MPLSTYQNYQPFDAVNYFLNHDLDPASNANTLRRAANGRVTNLLGQVFIDHSYGVAFFGNC